MLTKLPFIACLITSLLLGSTLTFAQTPSTKLILLGTGGGPLPRAHRAQTSQALVVNGQAYIIDAGDGLNRRIVQAGLNFTKINRSCPLLEPSPH